MDEFEDLESLLAFENDLFEEEPDAGKSTAADLASQREAAAGLIPAQPKNNKAAGIKRPRAPASDGDDDELLELAAAGAQGASSQPGRLAPEDEELLRQALMTQPSQGGKDGTDADLPMEEEGEAEEEEEEGGRAEDAVQPGASAGGQRQMDTILPQREYQAPLREAINVTGGCLTVTSAGGERVYAPLVPHERARSSAEKVDIAGALRRARGMLLSTPIQALIAEVEQEQFERALAETAAAAAAEAKAASSRDPASFAAATPGSGSKPAKNKVKGARKSSLWVDKYAPRTFLDLLSDEQINRDVVRWLKSWDACVFGTTAATTVAPAAKKAKAWPHDKSGGGGNSSGHFNGGNSSGGRYAAAPAPPDPLGRPEHKVILLCGPPGLGKTTLAHVVAWHCGYRALEINASDDRSGTALLARVVDAVQMRSVTGDKRPNCLIIDEIDGAAGGAEGRSAVAALLKVINAAPKGAAGGGAGGEGAPVKQNQQLFGARKNATAAAAAAADDEEGEDSDDEEEGDANKPAERPAGFHRRGADGAAAKQQRLRPLMRPIICICNDLYAPSLRPLRDVAKVFHFRRPSSERLAHRLQMVCAAEGLRAEKSTLRMFAERAECDVRSCLNTLQFLSKRQTVVRQADVAGMGVGQKDITKGAFQVWGELLQKKRGPAIIGRASETDAQRSSRLYNMLMDFGDTELVLAGVHESLPALRFFDIGLHRTCQVLGHLQDADRLMRACHRGGDFGLMKYLPSAALLIGNVVSGPERPAISWPRGGGEVRRRTAANRAVLQQWLMGMSPGVFAALGPAAAVTEVLPMLPWLSAPPLRPVSRHLFSRDEQTCVDGLVGTLISLGLKLSLVVEENEEEGQELGAGSGVGDPRGGQKDPPMQFKPPVHRLWHFKGAGPPVRRSLPIATRQMVLHEAEMEAIRRADSARQATAAAAAVGKGCGGFTAGAVGASSMEVDGQRAAAARASQQQRPTAGHVPLDLAARLRENNVAGRLAQAKTKVAKGTWLDVMRDRQQAQHGANATAAALAGGEAVGPSRFTVLYKFHEGYTNAVKRPIRLSELF